MIKQICILTKSYKDGGYCVAGIDLKTRQWVRLVPTIDDDDKIPYCYMNKYNINALDIIEIETLKHVPKGCQKENYLIDIKIPPKIIGSISFKELLAIKGFDKRNDIFGNRGKAITPDNADLLQYSLILIPVTNLKFSLEQDAETYKWTKKELSFKFENTDYTLPITDPQYKNVEYNGYTCESGAIVVSIPAIPYNNWHNKFVAKIFLENTQS